MLRNYLNYAGSKDRYYPLIREFLEKAVAKCKEDFPDFRPSFTDMFGGSAIVSLNSLDLFSTINVYDGCKELITLHRWLLSSTQGKYDPDTDTLVIDEDEDPVAAIHKVIDEYGLSKDNKEGFLKLREDYNKFKLGMYNELEDYTRPYRISDVRCHRSDWLYCLITHSFNYSLHLNSKGQFNAPSGAGRSYFSPSLENKLLEARRAVAKNLSSESRTIMSFVPHTLDNLVGLIPAIIRNRKEMITNNSLLGDEVFFVDPPYSAAVSKHPYRIGGLKWGDDDDRKLFKILDEIHENHGKFVFTNVFRNNGMENKPLQEWAKKYKVHHVGVDYSNCNYQRLNKGDTDEVIIYNF